MDTNTLLIGIRGTKPTDIKDIKADASLLPNRLRSSKRYQENYKDMEQIIALYPPEQYEYYLSGHSLGGGITNQMMRDFPFIQGTVDYNSAFQTFDLKKQNSKQKKIYTDQDFLYNLGGRYFKNIEVIPARPPESRVGILAQKLPIVGAIKTGLDGHALEQFEGRYG